MGRLIKCKVCGKQIDINYAYKATLYNSKGTPSNAYYCSEEHCEQGIKEHNERVERIKESQAVEDKVYYLICDIMGKKAIINSALYKERQVWRKVASDEVIGQYLEENKAYLTNAIARIDNIEYNRIRYLSAILKNKLGDYKPKAKEVEPAFSVVQEEHYETKFKNKKRRGFDELEEEWNE